MAGKCSLSYWIITTLDMPFSELKLSIQQMVVLLCFYRLLLSVFSSIRGGTTNTEKLRVNLLYRLYWNCRVSSIVCELCFVSRNQSSWSLLTCIRFSLQLITINAKLRWSLLITAYQNFLSKLRAITYFCFTQDISISKTGVNVSSITWHEDVNKYCNVYWNT